jgi:carboxyvinyl-carboxyphosphonate phosphorylmutase
MDWTERRRKFRNILSGSRCIHPGSVFDPVSVRIAEELGYEAASFAGSVASLTVLGAPDLVVLTLTEFAQQIYRINRAGRLPLIVDADHGYGNALNVMRTVEELETAGVAALSIEDTLLPAQYGGSDRVELIPIAEGAGKMRAALAARQDPALCIVARTSAMASTGTEDAVERIKAYAATGVDAIFLVGVKSREQLDAAARATKLPFVLGNIARDMHDLDYLAGRNTRIFLQGHGPFMAAVQAIHDTMLALRTGTAPKELKGLAPSEFINRLTRNADYGNWMRDFLGGTPGPRE